MGEQHFDNIQRSLGRIEAKVDGVDRRLAAGVIRFDKAEARITSVERRIWTFSGALGVAGTALGVFLKYFYDNGSGA